MSFRFSATGFALVVIAAVVVSAQQTPPAGAPSRGQAPAVATPGAGRGPTAPPPVQWSTPPAPAVTMAIDTGVQHMVWVVPTRGFNQPWSMAFLPDGGILITERPGCLRIVRGGVLDPRHIAGLPAVQAEAASRPHDVAREGSSPQRAAVSFQEMGFHSSRP